MSGPPDPVDSPYLVTPGERFRVADAATDPPRGARDRDANEAALAEASNRLRKLQRKLYADDRHALLLIFQAMDAAGKDGTVRAVMRGVNPAGCQVTSFKQPSREELDHDFLWRAARALPERGRIGIFNRSHYEEVLVVRVHPEILEKQRLPWIDRKRIWKQRLDAIRHFERHLAQSGTVILKFWLNVSRKEQARRFLARIDDPRRHWKFSAADVAERQHWDAYMDAYEEALTETSRHTAPWYAIPADDKPFMRRTVAEIVVATLEKLDLRYPEVSVEDRAMMLAQREVLAREI